MEDKSTILVCLGTGCIAENADGVFSSFEDLISELGLDVKLQKTGCPGFCQQGPIVVIEPEGLFYVKVSQDDVREIVDTLIHKRVVERLLYKDPLTKKPIPYHRDIPFYSKQERTVLRRCGRIDPENIDDYIASGGYSALRKALSMKPEEVIEEVKRAGLRGLGGAGFPTGRKWESCFKIESDEKFVICNGDEGDPGAFQDRALMEGDPHSILEGMIIAGYAIGAGKGYVYVRAEYPLAIKPLSIAISQARDRGFLGENILGKGFTFDIEIFQGAGAFVCGESTALVKSIEGKRGMPESLPRPRTSEAGLWGKPTLLNNVKTFANIPLIILNGASKFSERGTEKSKGTAIFSLTGKVANCGLIEVPMGITLREIIFDIGGGIIEGKAFKAVQIGGPSGGCLPEHKLDLSVDFDSLKEAGAMMGSGGMVVMDEDTCMVDVARYFMDFSQRESCGQCIPCRLGTRQMFKILDDITTGKGVPEHMELLLKISDAVSKGSLCGLGRSAPNPVKTTLRYFRDEYEAHIFEKRCPSNVCMLDGGSEGED